MTICSVRASAAPIHTGSGRLNRADSTIVASIVLSGSSATKIVANAVTMVAGCTTAHSTRHRASRCPRTRVRTTDRSARPAVEPALRVAVTPPRYVGRVMRRWTIEQVVAIAPTPARFAAAEGLAVPVPLGALGADERAGVGALPGVRARAVRHDGRPRPRGLALHVPEPVAPVQARPRPARDVGRGQVPGGPAPAGGRSWVDGHARARGRRRHRRPRGAAGAADAGRRRGRRAGPPTAPPTSSGRATSASPACGAGLVELDRWLDDRMRTGLADPALARYATWDDLAARLVDARAGALANRVRRLAGVVGARPDWHEVVLAELGVLHLLAQAGQRVPELPGAARRRRGHGVRLAGPPGRRAGRRARDRHWVVAGRSDTREDRIEVRRTWLRGPALGPLGDGAVVRRLPPVARRLARRRRGDHRRPAPLPRAVVAGARRHASTTPGRRRPGRAAGRRRSPTACAEVGAALAAEPWVDRVPATVRRHADRRPAVGGCSPTTPARSPLAPDAPGPRRRCSPRRRARPSTSPSSGRSTASSRSPSTSPTAPSTSARAPTRRS